MTANLWTVVLAAGAGRRLSGVTGGVPKQFWRIDNGMSLLEETIARFLPLAPPTRTVVIVDASHREHLLARRRFAAMGTTVFQPQDRGTAAGVLLALTPVLASAPDAVVAVTPADHGVTDVVGYRCGLLKAIRHVRAHGGVVIFGVRPSEAREDYGWITPGPVRIGMSVRTVVSFVEKPVPEVAAALMTAGAVWNTMVVVGHARALRDLYVHLLPDLTARIEEAIGRPGAEREARLASTYETLPTLDFSRDLIARARGLLTYIWPSSIGWSDLGTPERLQAWQEQHGGPAAIGRAISVA